MKQMKLGMAVCLLGLTVACTKGMKDRLFGSDETPPVSGAGPTSPNASSVNDQLMNQVALDLQKDLTANGAKGFFAPQAAACVPGPITSSSSTVTYPPQVYGSSRVYTVNGVTYFSANYSRSSGGSLVYVKEMNGTCLKNSSIYGTTSTEGSSYVQWVGADKQTKYQWYYYQYTYKYKGDILLIEGQYTIGTEKGSTVYPVKWTINI